MSEPVRPPNPADPAPVPAAASVDVVMLIDPHPLDSYIAACALRPERVHLIYAACMAGTYELLAEHLQRRLGIEVVGLEVMDDTSLDELIRVAARLPAQAHLHYTGGTGALAAHAQTIFDSRPGHVGSCLDEERHLLRFDDGRDLKLRPLVDNDHVTLEDIASLQGYRIVNVARIRQTGARGRRDALIVACNVLGQPLEPEELVRLQEIRQGKGRSWNKFRTGGWLELLTEMAVRQIVPDYGIHVGVMLKRNDPTLELDVVAIGRYHPYVISCSTSHKGGDAKDKTFEVVARTHRLAGSVGRPALVTLIDEGSRPSPSRLMQDLDLPFESPAQPVIFDRPVVQGWLRGFRAKTDDAIDPGPFQSLRDWIEH